MKEKSCGAIVINQGRVLMIKSIIGDYGFPKGHIELGETEQETAIREVKEETNVDIVINSDKKYCLSYLVNNKIPKDVIYFIAQPINEIKIIPQSGEINKVMWVDIDQVYNTLSYDNIKKLWQQILKDMI